MPGITAASGCASYAGIPLTHRDYSQSVQFVTGHLKEDKLDLDWSSLAKGQQTLVFYMGLSTLDQISEQLINNGMDSATPAAIIQQGTTKHQRVIVETLSKLPKVVRSKKIKAPTIIIVGDVVKLRSKLNWFEPG